MGIQRGRGSRRQKREREILRVKKASSLLCHIEEVGQNLDYKGYLTQEKNTNIRRLTRFSLLLISNAQYVVLRNSKESHA